MDRDAIPGERGLRLPPKTAIKIKIKIKIRSRIKN